MSRSPGPVLVTVLDTPAGPLSLLAHDDSLVGAGLSSLVRSGACGGWSTAVGALKGASWRAVGRSSKADGVAWKDPWKKDWESGKGDGESWKGDCASGNGGLDVTSGVPIPLAGDNPLAGGGEPPTGVPQVRQNRASGAFS